jgi:polysaccharide biosynthesis/export protein
MNYIHNKLFLFLIIVGTCFFNSVNSQSIGDLQALQSVMSSQGQLQSGNINNSRTDQNNNQEQNSEDSTEDRDTEQAIEVPATPKPDDLNIKPEPKKLNANLKRFGYDLFKRKGNRNNFSTVTNVPVSSNYILGPGDDLNIILFGSLNRIYNPRVDRDGSIFIPELGVIQVAGLKFSEIKEILDDRVNNQFNGIQVSVTLGQLKSIQVYILGEANQPGSYTVSGLSTLTNAIFQSGGVNKNGSLRNIQLKRNGELVINFDFYDLLLKGDTSNDQRLQDGDVIFIPPIVKSAGIDGEVNRPAVFELKDNDTLKDLVNFSGGFLSTAHKSTSQIERIHSYDGRTIIDIDLETEGASNIEILNGDILYIYPIINSMQDVVLLSGFVKRPGFSQWKEGLKISDFIDSAKQDLLPGMDTNYVLIKRENPNDKSFKALQVNLNKILADKESEDIELLNRDEVFFFSMRDEPKNDENSKQSLRDKVNYLQQEKMKLESEKLTLTLDKQSNSRSENNVSQFQSFEQEPTVIQDLIDEEKEMIVMKNLVVQIIQKEEFSIYESEGFVKVREDNELLNQLKVKTDELSGNRSIIIKPFIELLKRQGKPLEPAKVASISGAVYFPGDYPLTPLMTIEDLVDASGGLKDTTFIEDIEVTRVNLNGKEFVSSRKSIDSDDLSELISPGDRVLIKSAKKELRTVKIEGEVFFPGLYYLEEGETLSTLIQRSGGLTNRAFLPAAYFQRESLKEAQLQRLKAAKKSLQQELLFQSTRAGDVGSEETNINGVLQLINMSDEDEEELAGRLVLNIKEMIDGISDDLILKHNDRLVIPTRPQSVSVIGEVYVPTSHIFSNNSNLDNYLALSGGIKPSAESEAIYIIKADGSIITSNNGSSFFRNSRNEVSPGDTIVVPFKTSTFSGLRATQEVTQIIYELAVAAAAISSFGN